MHAHKYTTPELIHGMGQIEKKEVDFLFHYIEHFIKWWSCTSINKEGKIMIISLNEGHAHHHAMVFFFHCFIDQIMLIYSKCIFFFFYRNHSIHLSWQQCHTCTQYRLTLVSFRRSCESDEIKTKTWTKNFHANSTLDRF